MVAIDLTKGKAHSLRLVTDSVLDLSIQEDQKTVVVLDETGNVFSQSLDTGAAQSILELPHESLGSRYFNRKGGLSLDGRFVATMTDDSVLVTPLYGKEKTPKTFKLPSTPGDDTKYFVRFSPDGKKLVARKGDIVSVTDIASGNQFQMNIGTTSVDDAEFSSEGNHLILKNRYGAGSEIKDISNNDFSYFPVDPVFANFTFLNEPGKPVSLHTLNRAKGPAGVEGLEVVCASLAPSPLEREALDGPTRSQVRESELRRLRANQACDSDKTDLPSELSWLEGGDPRELNSLDRAYRFLFAMQRPGNFKPARDLPFLLSLIRGRFYQTDPDLLSTVLANVLRSSTVLFERLVKDYPSLEKMSSQPNAIASASDLCLTEADLDKHKAAADEYITERLAMNLDFEGEPKVPATVEDWKYLSPLTPLLSRLSEERRAFHLDKVADTVYATAMATPLLNSLDAATKLKYAIESMKPFFGFPTSHFTDAVLDETGFSPRLLVVGTDEIEVPEYDRSMDGRLSSVVGMNAKLLAVGNRSVEWRHHGDNWRAHVTLPNRWEDPSLENLTSEQVTTILSNPKTCHISSSHSHWVIDGVMESRLKESPERRPYVKTAGSAEDMLPLCESMKNELGAKSCEGIDFGGHMGGGCSVHNLFGIMYVRHESSGSSSVTKMDTLPNDAEKFKATAACFKDLLKDGFPVTFTSCFSATAAPMKAMSDIFEAPIIASKGLCSSNEWGAECRSGFSRYTPGKKGAAKELPVRIERMGSSELNR